MKSATLFSAKQALALAVKMAWMEFANRHRRSYMGLLWSVIYPLVTVAILWFVFSRAFKAQPSRGNVPFIVWLLAGMAAWNFFAEALASATQAITGNAFILRKHSFNLLLLPVIRVFASFFSHCLFLGIVAFLFLCNGSYPSIHWLQLPYYILCTLVLALGAGLVTSSVSVFIPDMDHVVSVFIQVFFWMTPVFWSFSMLSPRLAAILGLNPVAYIVQGYRTALLGEGWFWEKGTGALAFWLAAIVLLACGHAVFIRLKPQFADVL